MEHEVFIQKAVEIVLTGIFDVISVPKDPVVEIGEAGFGVCVHLRKTNLDHRRRKQIVAIERDKIAPSGMAETRITCRGSPRFCR